MFNNFHIMILNFVGTILHLTERNTILPHFVTVIKSFGIWGVWLEQD